MKSILDNKDSFKLQKGYLNVANMDVKLVSEPKAHLGIWLVEKTNHNLSIGFVAKLIGMSIDTNWDRFFLLPEIVPTFNGNEGKSIYFLWIFINIMLASDKGIFDPGNLEEAQKMYSERGFQRREIFQKIWWVPGLKPNT